MSSTTVLELTRVPEYSRTSLTQSRRSNGSIARYEQAASDRGSDSPEDGRVEEEGSVGQQLPPPDRGAAAWKVLIGAFVFESILWGKESLQQEQKEHLLKYAIQDSP